MIEMIKLLDRRLSVCTPKVDTIYKLWFAMLIKNVPHVEIFLFHLRGSNIVIVIGGLTFNALHYPLPLTYVSNIQLMKKSVTTSCLFSVNIKISI